MNLCNNNDDNVIIIIVMTTTKTTFYSNGILFIKHFENFNLIMSPKFMM